MCGLMLKQVTTDDLTSSVESQKSVAQETGQGQGFNIESSESPLNRSLLMKIWIRQLRVLGYCPLKASQFAPMMT